MTRRESAVVQKLLARCAPSATVLDLPCGGGRLSPAIGRFAQTLIEMDLSPGQLLYGLRYGRSNVPQIWVRGSALDVPLKDRSVDVSVCVRLSHHLYLREERERLLAELLRVTRQFAIFYFVDGDALRNRLRRWRNRHNSTVRKVNWMTRSELNALLPQLGGRMVACSSAGWFGPHRYALIQKTANVAREARESF
jgi:SAM-dependent methyltransferase